MRGQPLILMLALLGGVTSSSPAQAQDAEAEPTEQVVPGPASVDGAESHYQVAVRLFGEGRYREALDEFDAAIAISPQSIFYCNRAIVLIKLQEPEAALESLQTCQATHAGSAADLADIDAQRQAVEVLVAHVRPGVLATVSAINAPMLVAEPPRGWTRVETGIVLLGAGGAALASAATLDFLSQDIKEELAARAAARVQPGADYAQRQAEYVEVREDYVRRQRIWIGLTAAGAVLTVTGATLVLSRWLGGDQPLEAGVGGPASGVFVRGRW